MYERPRVCLCPSRLKDVVPQSSGRRRRLAYIVPRAFGFKSYVPSTSFHVSGNSEDVSQTSDVPRD